MVKTRLFRGLGVAAYHPNLSPSSPRPVSLGDEKIRRLGNHRTTAHNETISMSDLTAGFFEFNSAELYGAYMFGFYDQANPYDLLKNRGCESMPNFGRLEICISFPRASDNFAVYIRGSSQYVATKYTISWGSNLDHSIVSDFTSEDPDGTIQILGSQALARYLMPTYTPRRIRINYHSRRP